MQIYLNEPVIDISGNPFQWWSMNSKRLPLLSSIAKRYLALPATRSSLERIFSVALRPRRRARLSVEVTKMLINLFGFDPPPARIQVWG